MPSENNLLEIKPDDAIIGTLNFKPYRNSAVRRAERYLPGEDEPKSKTVVQPWGGTLTITVGDYLVSEVDRPEDSWPVKKSIFEKTYVQIGPNQFQKKELTMLVPLRDVTGDPEEKVIVHTREGDLTVRSGDFYLARGVEGEIWPIQNEMVERNMVQVSE
jgi:hypothetical protein